MADQNTVQYFRERESAERARALRATDAIAKKLHLDLAEEYAKVVASDETLERLRANHKRALIMGEDDLESSPKRLKQRER